MWADAQARGAIKSCEQWLTKVAATHELFSCAGDLRSSTSRVRHFGRDHELDPGSGRGDAIGHGEVGFNELPVIICDGLHAVCRASLTGPVRHVVALPRNLALMSRSARQDTIDRALAEFQISHGEIMVTERRTTGAQLAQQHRPHHYDG